MHEGVATVAKVFAGGGLVWSLALIVVVRGGQGRVRMLLACCSARYTVVLPLWRHIGTGDRTGCDVCLPGNRGSWLGLRSCRAQHKRGAWAERWLEALDEMMMSGKG